jgi:hypothetical protein
MGLLDDAIREHLDLKRRRGADPSEVERDEREALGPVRRGPEDVAMDELDVDGSDLDHPELEHEELIDRDEEFLDHDEEVKYVDAEPEWDEGLSAEPGSAAHPPAVDDGELEEPLASPTLHDEEALDSPTTSDPRPATAIDHGEDTAEYDVERELDKEHRGELDEKLEGKDGEDVLEETPDFLQDTPEHDRLWFEQRKPRDFDFDG